MSALLVTQVGDAYIVVAGLQRATAGVRPATTLRQTHRRSLTISHTRGGTATEAQQDRSGGALSEQRTRAMLDRVFALALALQVRATQGEGSDLRSHLRPAPLSQDALADLRIELSIPLRARMGVHCGTVVTGIVGSQRPRFCALDDGREDTEGSAGASALLCVEQSLWKLLPTRFTPPPPGVLGPAMLEAESIEAAGVPDELTCTVAAQQLYLSATFRFSPVPHAAGAAAAGSGGSSTPTGLLVRRPNRSLHTSRTTAAEVVGEDLTQQ